MNNGYSLLKNLAGDCLSKLLHKPVNGGLFVDQENDDCDKWANFGKKG
jgi:hypothetical protein